MFAYDGKTDLIAGYHDRSGWARNPDWHAIYSEDSISRVQELLKKGERTVPEPIQKAIDEYFPENVSNTLLTDPDLRFSINISQFSLPS